MRETTVTVCNLYYDLLFIFKLKRTTISYDGGKPHKTWTSSAVLTLKTGNNLTIEEALH
jgi:hypothetical protein